MSLTNLCMAFHFQDLDALDNSCARVVDAVEHSLESVRTLTYDLWSHMIVTDL